MYKRSERLRELFLQEIAASLKEVKDPGLSGFLTVTDLALSPDAKTARVYYSLLGSSEDRASTQRALERSMRFLRQRLYARLRLKFIPRFIFAFDETPEHAQRIENLLQAVSPEGAPELPAPVAESEYLHKLGSGSKRRPGRRAARRRGR